MIRTLGLASELMAMRGLSEVTDHGGYLVQRTASEPDYWVGNQIILRQANTQPDFAIAQFQAHFPHAGHIAIVWDIPNLDPAEIDPGFAAAGCKTDTSDVLTLQEPIATAEMPAGITVRPLAGDDDWAQSLEVQLEIGVEEGFELDRHNEYLMRRNHSRREQIAMGQGLWFGAFDGDRLVGQMGMFHDNSVARYQSVETRKSHRRRGICAGLLRHTCLWALDRAPQAVPVIIAEAGSDAGRLYRRMGFAQTEVLVGVLRPAYGLVAAVT